VCRCECVSDFWRRFSRGQPTRPADSYCARYKDHYTGHTRNFRHSYYNYQNFLVAWGLNVHTTSFRPVVVVVVAEIAVVVVIVVQIVGFVVVVVNYTGWKIGCWKIVGCFGNFENFDCFENLGYFGEFNI